MNNKNQKMPKKEFRKFYGLFRKAMNEPKFALLALSMLAYQNPVWFKNADIMYWQKRKKQ